jgi:hypothetical protein
MSVRGTDNRTIDCNGEKELARTQELQVDGFHYLGFAEKKGEKGFIASFRGIRLGYIREMFSTRCGLTAWIEKGVVREGRKEGMNGVSGE